MPLGLIICAIIGLTTGSEYISTIISMLGIGGLSSLLIVFKLKKSESLKKSVKYVLVFCNYTDIFISYILSGNSENVSKKMP